MKALKSELAKKVLSDPRGKEQLRTYLANKRVGTVARSASSGAFIEFRDKEGKTVRVTPTIVPKAA
jgi:hypothetical protein